jgi:hypothetical protein
VNELKSCEAGLPIDDQKKRLAAIAGAQFSGATTHDPELSGLHYPPDVRDERTSGIFVSIDFNGDEADTVALRKAGLDRRMRDAMSPCTPRTARTSPSSNSTHE